MNNHIYTIALQAMLFFASTNSTLYAMDAQDPVTKALIAFDIQTVNAVSHGTGLSYTGYNNKNGIMHAACYNENFFQASVTPDNRQLIGCPGKIYAFLESQYHKQQAFLKLHTK